MAVSIQHLTQDKPALVTISPGATIQEAIVQMLEHDFSQLPVEENGRPYGKPASFITSTSIARAIRMFGTSLGDLHVRDAVVPARTVLEDEDFFSKMDDLLDAYAVLVLKPDGTLAGIVTNYDTTQYFRRRAEDMLLVEDIETTLKDHVRIAYGGDETDPSGALRTAINALSTPNDSIRENCRKAFRSFCGRRGIQVTDAEVAECIDQRFATVKEGRSFDDLTLNEYIQLARRSEAWATLGPVFGISDKAFYELLEGVRKTRNKLMHFRPDIDTLERDRLRFCAEWFLNHPPLIGEADSPGGTRGADAPDSSPHGDPPQPDALTYIGDSALEGGAADSSGVASKYAPLAAYLAQQSRRLERLALSFSDVESIIGAPLPAAAREHRSWWANAATTHVQSSHWLNVSWRVVSINMSMERVLFARAHDRERAYISFYNSVQSRLRELADFPVHDVSPTGQNWLPLVRYPDHGLTLVLSFARRQRLRLECYIDAGDAGENERIFESLFNNQTLIESIVGSGLEWERLENRRACRVALYTSGSINDEPEQLAKLVDWSVQHAPRLHAAITQTLSDAP
jgi:CBS domain-containing protein